MRRTSQPRKPGRRGPLPLGVAAALAVGASLGGCGAAPEAQPVDGAARAAAMPGAPRTLAAPPDLQPGEWWTVEVDPKLVGAVYPTTMVVTDRAGDRASIGIPPGEFSHDFLVIHVPPIGDLDLNTFAWRVMRGDFEALRFPLEAGRTWTANFHGRDVNAEVTRVEGSRAFITMRGNNERIELVYDADVGMIVDFSEEALGLGFRITDHGFDYEGEVMRPAGIQLALMEAPAGAPAHHETTAGRPGRAVEVNTGRSHGSLGLILWNVGYENERGTYRVSATAPDGTVFQETFEVTTGAPSVAVKSFGHHGVDGTWHVEFGRDGPAGLLVELFAYDRTTIRSPRP